MSGTSFSRFGGEVGRNPRDNSFVGGDGVGGEGFSDRHLDVRQTPGAAGSPPMAQAKLRTIL